MLKLLPPQAAYPRVTLAALALAACARGDEDAAAEEAVPPVVGARTAVVTAQPFTETVDAIGTVTGRPGRSATLASPARSAIAVSSPTPSAWRRWR